MAAVEESDDRESSCHRLLIKLKTTVEGLLASHAVNGVWSTYGGLRRVYEDTEAILCHRINPRQASSSSDGSFWAFVQGLKWLSPSLAPVIEKVARHGQARAGSGGGQAEAGRAWLRDSIQEHSFVKQLDILLASQEHVNRFYQDDAFLRQAEYVKAMSICFSAIELNKPALLSDINPSLLKSHSKPETRDRWDTFPPSLSLSQDQSATLPASFSLPVRGNHRFNMGAKNSRKLEVNYPNVNSSTLSLCVDPSIGFRNSPQKTSSQPQYISQDSVTTVCPESLDNPQDWSEGSVYTSATTSSYETPTMLEEDLLGKMRRKNSSCSDSKSIDFQITPSSTSAGVVPAVDMSSPLMYDDISENVSSIRGDDDVDYRAIPHIQSADLGGARLLSLNSEDDFGMSSLNNSVEEASGEDLYKGSPKTSGFGSGQDPGTWRKDCVHSNIACDSCLSHFSPSGKRNSMRDDLSEGNATDAKLLHNTPYSFDQLVNNQKTIKVSLQKSFSISTDTFNLPSQSPSQSHSFVSTAVYHSQPRNEPSPPLSGITRVLSQSCIADSDPLSSISSTFKQQRSPFHSSSSNQDTDLVDVDPNSPTILSTSGRSTGAVYIPPNFERVAPSAVGQKMVRTPPRTAPSGFKPGHKRSVSDTKAIQMGRSQNFNDAIHRNSSANSGIVVRPNDVVASSGNQSQSGDDTKDTLFNKQGNGKGQDDVDTGASCMGYHSALTRPAEGQSLINYLISQDFNTCANMEKENAHFHISEVLISTFEAMSWDRMMKKTGSDRSSSSSDEEIQELRQRIRIRKREKMLEKNRPFPSVSDMQTDSHGMSPPNPYMSESSASEDESEEQRDFDLTMSSGAQGNLQSLKSTGLTLSLASLYSDAELAHRNQLLLRNSSQEENLTPGSAEQVAISLLKKFSEKHLPKASELKWLVSEVDAPQQLLPLPSSIPISPDDSDNSTTLLTTQTRLRGNLEWAPPRPQIIFSIHPTEKRAVVLTRQNFRCAGCGTRVDPAFIKRYRYCEYLGKYFCQCCHSGYTSVIPGKVIERWDFAPYPVSNFSYTLLEKMWCEPLFHIDSVNPGLYRRVRSLGPIKQGRQQLYHLHSLFEVCKRDVRLVTELLKLPDHWINNDNVYSMEDFFLVKNNSMLQTINAFVVAAFSHVNQCQLCQGLGFICGICQNQRIIFPFQLNTVSRCSVCHACYHKKCFVPDKCPKCMRINARRKQLVDAKPLTSPSSESVESQEGDITKQ